VRSARPADDWKVCEVAGIEDLLSQIPIGDLAKKLGVDEATATAAVQKAVPALVGGLQKNVENGGAASLDKALDKHAALADPTTIDDVDEEDGNKIVANVFGGKQQDVAAALAGSDGGGGGVDLGGIIGKVLPLVAPFVLSKLGNQKAAATQSGGGGFDLGGLLGGFLGGSGGQAGGQSGGSQAGGGGLDIGGILGGLGGLLGGGKK
jgi:hypothetical protein